MGPASGKLPLCPSEWAPQTHPLLPSRKESGSVHRSPISGTAGALAAPGVTKSAVDAGYRSDVTKGLSPLKGGHGF